MMVKRKLADFVCAFLAFAIILLSIALLTTESFFEGAAQWNGEEASLLLFGTEIVFDKTLPETAGRLVSFNDVIFGSGFSEGITAAAEFLIGYARDGISFFYHLARTAVGTE